MENHLMDKTSPNTEKIQPHPHFSILYKHIQRSSLSTAQTPPTPIPSPKEIAIPMFASSSSAITLLHSFPKKTHFPGKKIVASCATRENRASCSFAPKMASPASLYEVLGISMTADSHEIKAAYRKLARTCHPDVVAMNQKESSANEFKKIHSAYSTLSDPYKRAQYDREIYGHRKTLNYSNLTMAGFGQAGRNWETDQCW